MTSLANPIVFCHLELFKRYNWNNRESGMAAIPKIVFTKSKTQMRRWRCVWGWGVNRSVAPVGGCVAVGTWVSGSWSVRHFVWKLLKLLKHQWICTVGQKWDVLSFYRTKQVRIKWGVSFFLSLSSVCLSVCVFLCNFLFVLYFCQKMAMSIVQFES